MIVNRGTRRIKEYRILLGNTTVIDLLKSILLTLEQPRLVTHGTIFFYIALGVVRYLGSSVVFIVQQMALVMSFLSMFAVSGNMSETSGFQVCALVSECNVDELKEELFRETGRNFTNNVASGSDLRQKPLGYVVAALVSLPMFPIYIIVIYLRRKVKFY
ncbi:unnamed protein product [Gongylonema pulchrum]|uniref:ABC2_membrane domain-containing protein n=1 Tax=Gongylonema pulchrum TaxID=637853 RepID=A0A183ENF8_9BILA|nr:unnamed protein product [Gongylonema pulchrum]